MQRTSKSTPPQGKSADRPSAAARGLQCALILATISVACLISFPVSAHGGKGEKKGCASRTAKWATADPNSRGVAPKYGGKPLRAPNGYHHLEAVFTPPYRVKIYLYDAAGQPIQGAYFKGTVALRGEKGRAPAPLQLAPDGTLEAEIPNKSLPFAVDARISYGGPTGGPKPFDHVFKVGFEKPAPKTSAPQLKAETGP